MYTITKSITIPENEISFSFIRSSGPGGQHVNKVATAVQLRFNVMVSESIPDWIKKRIPKFAGRQLNSIGEIVIDAREYKSQEKNKHEAIVRLSALIEKASRRPRPRLKTKPTKSSIEKRLQKKKRHSGKKSIRRNAIEMN